MKMEQRTERFHVLLFLTVQGLVVHKHGVVRPLTCPSRVRFEVDADADADADVAS